MSRDDSSPLKRAAAILFALGSAEAFADGGLGVVRLAELVSREKSQVSRGLRALADAGLVERDPSTRLYRLSWRLFTLALRAGDARLLEAAPRLLAEAVERLGERINLCVREGPEVLTVLSESPPRTIRTAGWVGRLVSAHCTASGRALLHDHSLEELERVFAGIELEQLAPNTIRTVAELYARIEEDRTRGYALADEEFEIGLVAAGAPVRGFQGRIVACISLSAPKFRFAAQLDDAGRELKSVAEQVSSLLGWQTEATSLLTGR
jgi:IclR family KDG regulon transcriptional repressor